jgi:hypothetical protein
VQVDHRRMVRRAAWVSTPPMINRLLRDMRCPVCSVSTADEMDRPVMGRNF